MASLPNLTRRPVPLESLLARHAPARGGPVARPALRQPPPTLADLERRASIAPGTAERSEGGESVTPHDGAAVAIVLCVTRARCACGALYTYPNRSILVRFDSAGLSNAVHYARDSLSQYAALPRERKLLDIEIPYCEQCF